MALTLDEFLAFADSVAEKLPGFDTFAVRARKYPEVVEQFLPAIEAKLQDRAERFVSMGLVLPPALLPVTNEATPVETEPQQPTVSAPSSSFSPEQVQELVLSVISEKTGYDADELEPDFELEADLGIDTVKQAEIFGDVREQLGLAPDDEFSLADHPTIAGLQQWLVDKLAAASCEAPDDEPEQSEDRVITLVEEPIPADLFRTPTEVTEDPPTEDSLTPVLERVAQTAQARQFGQTVSGLPDSFRLRRPILVDRPLPAKRDLTGRVVRVIGREDLAKAMRREILSRGGTLTSPFDAADGAQPDVVIDAGDEVRESFTVAGDLNDVPPKWWLCLTRLGRDPSWTKPSDSLAAGARAGLAKALGREWTDCAAKVLDIEPELGLAEAAAIVCDELAAGDGAVEVFMSGQRRQTLELEVEAMPPTGLPLGGAPVIALTGGTRGITARVAMELARRGPCRLALLARTPPGEAPLDEKSSKERIKSDIMASGERATPIKVERALRRLRAREEARQNVLEMEQLGAEVAFFSVDLADAEAVEATLEAVRDRFGDIDGVVHGAGVEESRLLDAKTLDDFARVYDGKALGGLALVESLSDRAWFVSMGSVAGRFGNAGQVDYSAANEGMARVCLTRPRSLHVDWTAWADVGMAVRGGMATLLDQRGVEMLPAEPGAALLVDLILSGVTGEVMVAGKLGDFGAGCSHPLLDGVEFDGDAVVATVALSAERAPWIVDHSIGGTPVLPGVIGMEMMAAAASMARPTGRYQGAKDVSFKAPVKVHGDGHVDLIVRAEPVSRTEVKCSLRSERTGRTGRLLKTDHFEATIIVGDVRTTESLPPAFFPEESLSSEQIYQRFFHGPIFQVIERIDAVAKEVILGRARVDHAPISGGLITHPLSVESAFQVAGLHRMAVEGIMGLPNHIQRVFFLRNPDEAETLTVMARRVGELYDVDVDGENGPVLRLRGFRLIDTGPLPEDDRFATPDGGWPSAVVGELTQRPSGAAVRAALTSEELSVLTRRGTLRRQKDRIAGRVAAKQVVEALTGVPAHRFVIGNLASGQPAVAWRADGEGPVPGVSLSHRDGRAVAVAVDRGTPGIDLERIEHRSDAFVRTWFRENEVGLVGASNARRTMAWSAKEAVLKALGQGMALTPRDIEVTGLSTRQASVVLHGEAAQTPSAPPGGRITVYFHCVDGWVISMAWLPAAAPEMSPQAVLGANRPVQAA